MTKTITLDGIKYNIENLDGTAQQQLAALNFTNQRVRELTNLMAVLRRAKHSYVQSLKKEMISNKAGLLFGDDQTENEMPKITIDDIEYNTEDLSDNGKAQLASLQFLEAQMQKLNSEIAVYQTARIAYVNELKKELDEVKENK